MNEIEDKLINETHSRDKRSLDQFQLKQLNSLNGLGSRAYNPINHQYLNNSRGEVLRQQEANSKVVPDLLIVSPFLAR